MVLNPAGLALLLGRGREKNERLMRDQCVIERKTGTTVDPYGTVTDVWTEIYAGKCQVKNEQAYESSREAGGAIVAANRDVLKLPVHPAIEYQVGDRVTITEAGAGSATIPGAVYVVRNPDSGTLVTARRMHIENFPD